MRELLLKNTKTNVLFTKSKQVTKKQEKITDIIKSPERNVFSLELCPDQELNSDLLDKLAPPFCSVTWLGGNNNLKKNSALSFAQDLQNNGRNTLLHIAGRNMDKSQALEILLYAKKIGIRNILALQGDPARIIEKNDEKCDFPYASHLIRFIKSNFYDYFCIGVAGYPEIHPNSLNIEQDLHYLQEKVSAGADFIITQATFKPEAFEQYCKKCKNLSITVPILPGLFIISSTKMLIGMSKICGVPVPSSIMEIALKNQENTEIVRNFGIYLATEMIKVILQNHDLNLVHIFSLNNLEIVQQVSKRVWPKFSLLNAHKILNGRL